MPPILDPILNTKHLLFDKTEFLIDLRQTAKGTRYLEITQTIHANKAHRATIKINPKILNTLVKTLLEFNGQHDEAAAIPKDQYGEELEKLKTAYLKGAALESLKLQFSKYTVEEMEAMLRAEGIAIADQVYKQPKNRKQFWRRGRGN